MSSALQLAAQTIQENNYATIVVLTAIGYDYVLALANEIEYIWNKPWTWVSTLYLLARYSGLCAATTVSICSWKFFLAWTLDGNAILIFNTWSLCIFISSAELVMILRVWVLYNRSRLVLGGLLPLYAIETTLLVVSCCLVSAKSNPTAFITQVPDFLFCVIQPIPLTFLEVIDAVFFALAVLMCLLVAGRFIRGSLQVYRATKQFQLNRYVNILTRDGMLYFLAILLYAVINPLGLFNVSTSPYWPFIAVAEYVPVITLVPRFILSLRGFYARDVHVGQRTGIDTAFGLASIGQGNVESVIMFAETLQDEGEERTEGTAVEEREIRTRTDTTVV